MYLGTTGQPKGVVLSHINMLSFCAAANALTEYGRFPGILKSDVHISYLPLAHVFERILQISLINKGGRAGFYQGDTLKRKCIYLRAHDPFTLFTPTF